MTAVTEQTIRKLKSDQIGIGGSPASAEAFSVASTTKGSRPWPSMTTTERDAIVGIADGLTIYNTTTGRLNTVIGSAWVEVSTGEKILYNYLQDWFDGSKVTSVVSGLTATGNRTTDQTLWAAQNSSHLTISRSTSSPLRGAYSLLLDSGSTTDSFVESPMFTLSAADLGKPVTVSFDVADVAADNNYQVAVVRYNSSGTHQEIIRVAGNASATSPNSVKLPTGTTQFNGFFIAGSTATDQYAVRFYKQASANNDIKIDSLYVGPQSVVQGAAVTDWQNFTTAPAPGNFGTVTNAVWKYMRVGQNMRVRGSFQMGVRGATAVIAMPSGYVLDASATAASAARNIVGKWTASGGGSPTFATARTHGVLHIDPAANTTNIYFAYAVTDGTGLEKSAASNIGGADSQYVAVDFEVPIVGWSSNIQMADRAVEEYLSHDGTSQVNGANGAAMLTTTPGSTNEEFTLTPQSTVQSTDSWVVEIQRGGVGGWFPANDQIERLRNDGTNFIGVGVYYNGTDVKIIRGKYRSGSTNTWAGITAGTRWRVRKVSAGAVIGYETANKYTEFTYSNVGASTTRNHTISGITPGAVYKITTFAEFNRTATSASLYARFKVFNGNANTDPNILYTSLDNNVTTGSTECARFSQSRIVTALESNFYIEFQTSATAAINDPYIIIEKLVNYSTDSGVTST